MIFWRKGISASNSTPIPIDRGTSITIHPPRTAGPSSKPLSACHFTPTCLLPFSIYTSVIQNPPLFTCKLFKLLPWCSSSPFLFRPKIIEAVGTSGICQLSSSNALWLQRGSSTLPCSSSAPILHQLPFLSLFFFGLSSPLKLSHFILFTFSQCSPLCPSNGHLQLNLNYVSYQQPFSGWWAHSRRKPKAKGLPC